MLSCRPPVRRSALVVAAAVVAASVLTATGQFRVRRQFDGAPLSATPDDPSHDNKDTPAGVTVPDSPGAVERLAHAAEKEQQQQWKVAADFYREAVTQFPGRVVPAEIDPAAGTYRYTGVAAAVQERLARWPRAGLDDYRMRNGPAAADRLAAARRGDLATLTSIFYDDFVTDAGKAAGLRLVDAYAEAGDFPAAAAVGDRLLDLHPVLAGDRPAVLFRTALADHWGGDDAAAARRLGELRQSDPKAIGTVGGRDVVLADALTALLATPPARPAVDPTAADTYPSFGGPGGRGDVSPSTARPGASLNTVTFTPPDVSSLSGAAKTNWTQQDKASVAAGGARGVMPVVDAGTLFFQDGRTVYAVDADTGMPVTAWLGTYPGDGGGRYHLAAQGRARGEQLTVSVTPTAVLAVMGQRDRLMNGGGGFENGFRGGFVVQGGDGGPASTVRLVCLDRASGRERWKASPADLPDAAGAAKTAEYDGPVLAVPAAVAGTADDAVIAVARGGRDGQFDNCYLVCLSAATGQYRWTAFIGSGARTFDGDTYFGQDPSQLALADGRVVVMSNLGTVAALDPADGRILWLDAYKRDADANADPMAQQRAMMSGVGLPGNNRPWTRNPVVVQGGRVFALPADARSLLVLDAATGQQLQHIGTSLPTDGGPPEVADVLLGVHDGRAILAGKMSVFGVDWRAYVPDRAAAAVWDEQPWGADPSLAEKTAVAGRGFLTAQGIYVTNGQNLCQIDWRHHKIVALYPSAGTFAGGQGPGNVLVTSQNVVVAGTDRVDVYADLGVVTAKYEAQIAAAPADPDPRVRYAAALFAGGRPADALARLDQVIDLLGGRPAMRPGPDRARVFDVLLEFARRLDQPAGPATAPDPATLTLAAALFDRAADAADGPAQRVAYLLARGRFAADVAHDYRGQIELCQQVLADPALRRVAVTDEQTAAAAASAAIAAAVTADPTGQAYGPVEARAMAALADARGRGDPDALLAVADGFPNSRAAAAARQAAVDQFQATGRPGAAIDVLRQAYAGTGDPVARAATLERIAADFLATGPAGVGPAADRLARAGQLTSFNPVLASDLALPGGAVLRAGRATYVDAVDALRVTLAEADVARLPAFRLPSYAQAHADFVAAHHRRPQRFEEVSPFRPGPPAFIPDVTALVHPTRDYDRPDRLVTFGPAGLAVFDAGATTPRFRAAAVTDAPLGAAWVDGPAAAAAGGPTPAGRWVVWTPTRVVALTDDGRDAWPAAVAAADLPPAPAVAVGGAVVDDAPATAAGEPDGVQQVGGNGQVVVRVNGVNRRFLIRNGRLVPAPVAPAAGPPVALAGGEQVVAAQPADGVLLVSTSAGRLFAIDTADGHVRWQARPADRPADALLANAHFAVVRLDDDGGSTVVVYDTPTGRVVGRRKFTADGTVGQLVNVALGEEGTLAISRPTGVEIKDLYDPWAAPCEPVPTHGPQDPGPWTGMSQPDQLLVRGGRVVSLYDSGRFLVAYDLSRKTDPPPLSSASASANVWMRLAGPQLFVVQPGNLKRYDLADPADVSGTLFTAAVHHFRGLLLGSDFAVVVDDPVDRGPAGAPAVTLVALSRQVAPGRHVEGDLVTFANRIPSASGITDWAAADGVVYLLNTDGHLDLHHGGRPPATP